MEPTPSGLRRDAGGGPPDQCWWRRGRQRRLLSLGHGIGLGQRGRTMLMDCSRMRDHNVVLALRAYVPYTFNGEYTWEYRSLKVNSCSMRHFLTKSSTPSFLCVCICFAVSGNICIFDHQFLKKYVGSWHKIYVFRFTIRNTFLIYNPYVVKL